MISESISAPILAVRAVVISESDDGSVRVVSDATSDETWLCDRLLTGNELVALVPGDKVLCIPPTPTDRGVILGVIGRRPTQPIEQTPADEATDARPETLVLEAKQELILRVGDGSVTIRADGKILIKGKDLVSHATRVNRIKGGSVAIN
jgi:hypothetical protein